MTTSLGNLSLRLGADVPHLAADLKLAHDLIRQSYNDWQRIVSKPFKWQIAGDLGVELTVAEGLLDRSLRQMQSRIKAQKLKIDIEVGAIGVSGIAASLHDELRVARSIFNSGMKGIESDAKGYKLNIPVSIKVDQSIRQTIEKQFDSLNQRTIVIKVNDQQLTDLNKHLSKKEEHLDKVVSKFRSNRITPTTDERHLTQLNKSLDLTQRNLLELTKVASKKIVIETEVRGIPNIRKQIRDLERAQQEGIRINLPPVTSDQGKVTRRRPRMIIDADVKFDEKQVKQAHKKIAVEAEIIVRGKGSRGGGNPGIVSGFMQEIGRRGVAVVGAGIQRGFGIDPKDPTGGIQDKVANAIATPIKIFITENPEVKSAVDRTKDLVEARLRKAGYALGEAIIAGLDDESGTIQGKIGSFANAVKPHIGPAAKQVAEDATAISKDFGKAVLIGGGNSIAQNPVGEAVRNYKEGALRDVAIPKAVKRAGEIVAKGKTSNTGNVVTESTDELYIAIGGYAGARGLSGKQLASQIRPEVSPNAKVIWTQNKESDVTKASLGAFAASANKANLRGFSNDSIEAAAQSLAGLQKNPELKIKIVGHSGGADIAAEVAQLLKLTGAKNVEYIGIGGPDFIGGHKPPGRKIVSADEAFGENTNRYIAPIGLSAPATILGPREHDFASYRDAGLAEVQNFFKGKPQPLAAQEISTEKATAIEFGKIDTGGFNETQLASHAKQAFDRLQSIRRHIIDETGVVDQDLLEISKIYTDAFVATAPEHTPIAKARSAIATARSKFEQISKTPGIQSAQIAQQLNKELIEIQAELKSHSGFRTGTNQRKYQSIDAQLKDLITKTADPSLVIPNQSSTTQQIESPPVRVDLQNRPRISQQIPIEEETRSPRISQQIPIEEEVSVPNIEIPTIRNETRISLAALRGINQADIAQIVETAINPPQQLPLAPLPPLPTLLQAPQARPPSNLETFVRQNVPAEKPLGIDFSNVPVTDSGAIAKRIKQIKKRIDDEKAIIISQLDSGDPATIEQGLFRAGTLGLGQQILKSELKLLLGKAKAAKSQLASENPGLKPRQLAKAVPEYAEAEASRRTIQGHIDDKGATTRTIFERVQQLGENANLVGKINPRLKQGAVGAGVFGSILAALTTGAQAATIGGGAAAGGGLIAGLAPLLLPALGIGAVGAAGVAGYQNRGTIASAFNNARSRVGSFFSPQQPQPQPKPPTVIQSLFQQGANILAPIKEKAGEILSPIFGKAGQPGAINAEPLKVQIDSLKTSVLGLLGTFGGFGAALFAQQQLGRFTTSAFRAAVASEQLDRQLKFATGSSGAGTQLRQKATKEAYKYGLDLNSSIKTDAEFAGGTKGTSFEGAPTQYIATAFKEGALVRGLTDEQQKNAQLAITQMLGKGQIQAQELKGQLAQSGFSDAIPTLAKALNVSPQQLFHMMDKGEGLDSSAIAKFATQIKVDAASSLKDSAQSAPAQLARLGNAGTELQQKFGQSFVAPANAGISILATTVKSTADNFDSLNGIINAATILSLGKLVFSLTAVKGVLSSLSWSGFTSGIGGATKSILGFTGQALALAAVFESTKIAAAGFKLALGDTSDAPLGKLAKESVAQLDLIQTKIAEVKKEGGLKSLFAKDSFSPDNPVAQAADFMTGIRNWIDLSRFNPVRGDRGKSKGTFRNLNIEATKANIENIIYGEIDNNGTRWNPTAKLVSDLSTKTEPAQIEKIKQVEEEQSQTRTQLNVTKTSEREKLGRLTARSNQLNTEQIKLGEPLANAKSAISGRIGTLKSFIDSPELADLAKIDPKLAKQQKSAAVEQLNLLQQASDEAAKKINATSDRVRNLSLNFNLLNGVLAQALLASERQGVQTRTRLAKKSNPYNEGTNASAIKSAEEAEISRSIALKSQAQLKNLKELAEPQTKKTADILLESRETTLQEISPDQVKELQEIAKDSPDQKAAVDRIAKYVELRQQIASDQSRLATAQEEVKKSIFESDRSIRDYYRGLAYQFEDIKSALNAAKHQAGVLNIKSRLQDALSGQTGVVSAFVESMLGVSEALNEQVKIAQAAKDAIRANKRTYDQGVLTIQDNQRKAPNPSGVPQVAPLPAIGGDKSVPISTNFVSPFTGGSISPLATYKPTRGQDFNSPREGRPKHGGGDFDSRVGGQAGSSVFAMHDGIARVEDWRFGKNGKRYPTYGLAVETTFNQGGREIKLRQGHLTPESVRAAGLKSGQAAPIRAGQRIGTIANLNLSGTKNHLHIDITVDGQKVDPIRYFQDQMANGGGADVAAFASTVCNGCECGQCDAVKKITAPAKTRKKVKAPNLSPTLADAVGKKSKPTVRTVEPSKSKASVSVPIIPPLPIVTPKIAIPPTPPKQSVKPSKAAIPPTSPKQSAKPSKIIKDRHGKPLPPAYQQAIAEQEQRFRRQFVKKDTSILGGAAAGILRQTPLNQNQQPQENLVQKAWRKLQFWNQPAPRPIKRAAAKSGTVKSDITLAKSVVLDQVMLGVSKPETPLVGVGNEINVPKQLGIKKTLIDRVLTEIGQVESSNNYYAKNNGGSFSRNEATRGFPTSQIANQRIRGKLKSPDVGRYQFNVYDYKWAQRLDPSITNFLPENQDKIAIAKILQGGRGGQELVTFQQQPTLANATKVRKALGNEWEAFRDGTVAYGGKNRQVGTQEFYTSKVAGISPVPKGVRLKQYWNPNQDAKFYRNLLAATQSQQSTAPEVIKPISATTQIPGTLTQTLAGGITPDPNPSAQAQVDQAGAIRTTGDLKVNIESNASIKAAISTANLQGKRATFAFKTGLQDISDRIRGYKDRLQDLKSSGDRPTPGNQLNVDLREIDRKFGSLTIETQREVEKLTAEVETAQQSIQAIDQELANPTADTKIEPLKVLKANLIARKKQLEDNLTATKDVLKQLPTVRTAARTEKLANFGKEELDRVLDRTELEDRQALAKLENRRAIASNHVETHPGDYSLGNPIDLKNQIDIGQAQQEADSAFRALYDKYFKGVLGKTPKANLDKYNELAIIEQQKLDGKMAAIQAETALARQNYDLTLKAIVLERSRRESQGKIELLSSQATGAEAYRQYNRDSYRRGDPIELRYASENEQEKVRHGAAIADMAEREKKNQTPENLTAIKAEREREFAINQQNTENIGQNRTNARNVQDLESFQRRATVPNLIADRYERQDGTLGQFKSDGIRRELRIQEAALKVNSGEIPGGFKGAQYHEELLRIIDDTDTLGKTLQPIKQEFSSFFGSLSDDSKTFGDKIKGFFRGITNSLLEMVNKVLVDQIWGNVTRGLKDITNKDTSGAILVGDSGVYTGQGGINGAIIRGANQQPTVSNSVQPEKTSSFITPSSIPPLWGLDPSNPNRVQPQPKIAQDFQSSSKVTSVETKSVESSILTPLPPIPSTAQELKQYGINWAGIEPSATVQPIESSIPTPPPPAPPTAQELKQYGINWAGIEPSATMQPIEQAGISVSNDLVSGATQAAQILKSAGELTGKSLSEFNLSGSKIDPFKPSIDSNVPLGESSKTFDFKIPESEQSTVKTGDQNRWISSISEGIQSATANNKGSKMLSDGVGLIGNLASNKSAKDGGAGLIGGLISLAGSLFGFADGGVAGKDGLPISKFADGGIATNTPIAADGTIGSGRGKADDQLLFVPPGTGVITHQGVDLFKGMKSGLMPILAQRGERIMPPKQVQMLGSDNLKSINRGIVPNKFATGGIVGDLSIPARSTNDPTLVPAPVVKGFANGVPGRMNAGNNVSVEVNVANNGQAQTTTKGDGAAIGKAMSSVVVQEIIRQQRPGGLLYK